MDKKESMISKVKLHYDNHLSELYSWMAGDFTEKVSEIKEQYF